VKFCIVRKRFINYVTNKNKWLRKVLIVPNRT
jgi:hypothetical protein